ncbi:MAG: hypothetical protein NTV33_03270 [Coprothermobacterota bacterium]|nr:hypothetical protein [Coprothermobacterota bacterium]
MQKQPKAENNKFEALQNVTQSSIGGLSRCKNSQKQKIIKKQPLTP